MKKQTKRPCDCWLDVGECYCASDDIFHINDEDSKYEKTEGNN
jgi:hypothetical protein